MMNRVYVEITNICNLHCDFCPGTTRPLMAMRTDDFESAARQLRRVSEYIYLHVMGEPLLHPELGKILDTCARLEFKVCLTTNGLLLPRRVEVLRACPSLDRVAVSLHAYEGNRRMDTTLEQYVTGCAESCLTLAEGGVNCTLRLWNRGAPTALNPEIQRILGGAIGCDMANLPKDRLGNRRLAPHLYLQEADRFLWPGDSSNDGPDAQSCYGLRRQLAVLCDGTVVPCCLDSEGRLALGNIYRQPLEDILSSSRAQRIRKGFENRSPAEVLCRRCNYAMRFNAE